MHQVCKRDPVTEIGQGRKVAPHIIIDRQPTFGLQQQNCRAGKLLADRCDAERRLGANRNTEFDAGHAGTLVHDKIAAYHHAERHAWPVGLTPRRKQSLDATAKQQVIEIVHRRH